MELVAERVAKCGEAAKRLLVDFSAGFDLETNDIALVGFGDEIDFLSVVRSPVTHLAHVVAPGGLLQDLADNESFEKMTEFAQSGRMASCELFGSGPTIGPLSRRY